MAKIVVLSTADMNSAVWTNKQHLATRLAADHDVTYIESLGLRRPVLNSSDIQRIWTRLFRKKKSTSIMNIPASLKVISPQVIPFHENALARKINAKLLTRQVQTIVGEKRQHCILWSFSPVTYGIEKFFDSVVYHSVDLLHEIEGLPKKQLLEDEQNLVKNADAIIASSIQVRRHLSEVTANKVLLWENVADTELYSSVQTKRYSRAIFAGNLTPGKVNFGILKEVADAGTHVVLAGPTAIDGSAQDEELQSLLLHENVEYLGNLRPHSLADALNSCTVGLIPYRINPYTQGVFPMKVYEYMASGLTVISTRLPSLSEVDNPSLIPADPEDFPSAVSKWIAPSQEQVSANRCLAAGKSWTSRTAQADALIRELEESLD